MGLSQHGLIAARHHPLPQADSAFCSYAARASYVLVYFNTFVVHRRRIDFNVCRKSSGDVSRGAHPFELDSHAHSLIQTERHTRFRGGRVRGRQTDVVRKVDAFGGGVSNPPSLSGGAVISTIDAYLIKSERGTNDINAAH